MPDRRSRKHPSPGERPGRTDETETTAAAGAARATTPARVTADAAGGSDREPGDPRRAGDRRDTGPRTGPGAGTGSDQDPDGERRRRRAQFLRDLAEARELRDRVQPRRAKAARLRHAMRMRTFRW
ncbi:hypothetical protein [Streptomyces sp. NRRL S-340]|uniref:hypothetical protein n=1 Tax=Streptomyces sp. NRRL S-340 TaxID=1463901 RepID=UPI000563C8D4|nr:hypothetical protein [Streptomyces sp. NRRL S-340]